VSQALTCFWFVGFAVRDTVSILSLIYRTGLIWEFVFVYTA
jgi:hypothetical protein